MKMHIIWSNDVEHIEKLMEDDPELVWESAYELNAEYLEDERANLNIEVGDEIIVLADLGLWYGRRHGYKLIRKTNIADCLCGTCGDYVTWFVDDRGDLMCRDIHHDGTNIYMYRAWKAETTDEQKRNFLQKIYDGKATRKDITRYTRKIGVYVADVYGWKVRR